ncbi:MAG: hypothetical protein FD189_2205 [Elusimicrobia bacterium]|nr:MAG: hypothetical protein FD154_2218 [Elusimicrobiota bacterium]KAF0153898.1 MAG: hypothetical protein FD189_2205 [Elusimicrobiota bacterium]
MNLFLATTILLTLAAPAAAGETCSLKMMAVKGGVSYSHELPAVPGERASYAGPANKRGRGPQRELIFNAMLNEAGEGGFRLDYQVEVAEEKGPPRPPFQAQGKVPLRPGKQVLAASAAGWKLYFRLDGEACAGERGWEKAGTLSARLKCGKLSYPVSFAYLTNEQYMTVLYEEPAENTVRRLTVGLLPGPSAFDGTFQLQYVLNLREGGQVITDSQGKVLLAPGGGSQHAAAGRGCSFTVTASR